MPTSVAASAPKACEMAVRCGMAVIGIQIEIAAPMAEPSTRPSEDPREVDDAMVDERADDGHQHADGGQLHAAAGLVGRGQPAQARG